MQQRRITSSRQLPEIPREIPRETAILYALFPMDAYHRKAVIKTPDGGNKEGLIYPSFSSASILRYYDVEIKEVGDENTIFNVDALGYVASPITGKTIPARYKGELGVNSRIDNLYSETAYEIGYMAISADLAARMLAHLKKNGILAVKTGKIVTSVVRCLPTGCIIMNSEVATYKCHQDSRSMVGVIGVLEHSIKDHFFSSEAEKVSNLIDRLSETSIKVFGREKLRIIEAYRSRFWYRVDDKGSGLDSNRYLVRRCIRSWLCMNLVEGKDSLDISVYAVMPRPLRMIYHHPVLRGVPFAMAYNIDRDGFSDFFEDAERAASKKGYRTDRIKEIEDIVAGGYAYSKLNTKNMFTPTVDILESVREAVEELGSRAAVFAPR